MLGRAGVGDAGGGEAEVALAALDPEERRLLAYASAIGSEFDFALLVGATGTDEELLAERLERLVRRGLLRERPGGERFAFAEEELRARIYRSLTESRLRVLHRKIAEVTERAHPEPSGPVLAELGRHYFLGKVPDRSLEFNRRAAAAAEADGETTIAIHHWERVLLDLAAVPGDRRAERAEVAARLGDLNYATSNFRVADRHYAEALEGVRRDEPRLRARLLLARAEIAREGLDAARAMERAGEALHLFESAGDAVGIAQAYQLLGRVAFQRGAYRESLDQGMRALAVLPADADPRYLGRLSIDIGNAFALLGEEVRPVAIEWYGRAVDKLRAAHDWLELTRALHNLGVIVGETRPEDGLEHLEAARVAAERAHDVRFLGRTLLSGVEMRLQLGQLEEAQRDNEQAGRLLERLGDDLGLEQVEVNRGLIAEKAGQWEDAERAYARSAELARQSQIVADEAEALFLLARLRYKTRDFGGARDAYRRATELNLVELVPRLRASYDLLGRDLAAVEAGGAPPPASVAERR